ncbi:MAG: hypothetical protein SVU69_11170 [Pseudomonadota bacterium]|nr:hypothetical protein [Pseudomonadota bacterium]
MTISPIALGRAAVETHRQARWAPERQKAWVDAQLRRVVKEAGLQVPFYRTRFAESDIDLENFRGLADLNRLPFLTKADVQSNYPDGLVADGVRLEDCVESATTGSTGKATRFAFSPETYAFYLATSLRVYTMAGLKPWYRGAYIKYSPIPLPDLGRFSPMLHIPSIMAAEEQLRRLVAFRPNVLIGYASIILELARLITPSDLARMPLKFISVNSELSTPAERAYIAERFGCPVYDEYSTEETWMVASQCREGNYHLFTDNVWVEVLDEHGLPAAPGEIGEIVLTTLRSPAMPFIRYRIGDFGRRAATDARCPCGRGLPLLESFEGRCDDAYVLSDDTRLSPLKLLNTFTMFIKSDPGLIDEFHFVQTALGQARVDLVPGPRYDAARGAALVAALEHVISEPVSIELALVEQISGPASIKRKAIESLIRPSPRAA